MKITIEIDEDDPRFKKLICFLDKLGGVKTSDAGNDKEQEDGYEENKDSTDGIEDELLKQAVTLMHDTEKRILASSTSQTPMSRPPAWWDVSGTTVLAEYPDGLVSVGTFDKSTLPFSVFLSSSDRPYKPLLGVTGYGTTLYSAFTEFKAIFQSEFKKRNK